MYVIFSLEDEIWLLQGGGCFTAEYIRRLAVLRYRNLTK